MNPNNPNMKLFNCCIQGDASWQHIHVSSAFLLWSPPLIYNWCNYTPLKQWVVSVSEHNNWNFGVIIYLPAFCWGGGLLQTRWLSDRKRCCLSATDSPDPLRLIFTAQQDKFSTADNDINKWQELVIEQGFNSPAWNMNWVPLFYQMKYWGLICQHARFKFPIVLKAAAFPVLQDYFKQTCQAENSVSSLGDWSYLSFWNEIMRVQTTFGPLDCKFKVFERMN